MSAQAWFIAGTIPPILAGGAHALLTLVDVVRPTYFAPRDAAVTPAMEDTTVRFGGRAAPTMWNAWLGFNISHGLGVFVFGLLCLLMGAHDFDGLGAIRPLAVGFAATYLVVALRFWFWGPVLITATSTVCFTIAAIA